MTLSLTSLMDKYRTTIEGAKPRPELASGKLYENRICLSVTEFAAQTGLSTKSVERLIKRGEIQCKRVGRRLLIPVNTIEAWLNQKE